MYIGAAERAGAAVICGMCKGKGFIWFKYEEFTGLDKRQDVERVYLSSYGYIIAPKEIDFKEHGKIDLGKEGVSYEEWLEGKRPEHIQQLVCPMLADQGACHDIKGFVDMCETLHGKGMWGISLTKCRHQTKKHECWKRFDQNSL